MQPIPRTVFAGLLLAATACVSNAEVLYTFAGPQLVNDNNAFALPGLNLSRDASAQGTLYFKYTVTNPASNNTTEFYYAGMSFYNGVSENLGIGNGWNPWAYSAFSGGLPGGNLDLRSATPDPGQTYQQVRATDVTTIVIRVDFNSFANDNITVWLNPNLALPEAAQDPALTTRFIAMADFDTIYLREGGQAGEGWNFSDIAIAENSSDEGFFAAPLTTASWDGGGSDSNWSNASNWLGDIAPAAGYDLSFPNSPNTSPINDLPPGTAFSGLNFDGGATTYTLTGNAIGISNFVRNTSVNPQSVNLPLQLNGPLTLDALNSSLAIGGSISGPHGITKTGNNRLEFTAHNQYTGDTSINNGTLAIGDGEMTGSIDSTGTLSFGASTTTRLEVFRYDDITMGNPITTGGRANIAALGGGKVILTGPISGTGEFWTHGPGTVQIKPHLGSANFASSVVISNGTLEIEDFSTSTLGSAMIFIGQAGSGTLRYTGPTTSTDRVGEYALQGAGTNTFIEVVSPNTELTFTQPLGDNAPFNKGLIKTGPGTLILAVAHTYNGDTIVEDGELRLTQPGFADTSTVIVAENGRLNLDFVGSDTVTGIMLGPDDMAPGTYSAATHPQFISGSGSLVIPSSATDYDTWKTNNGVTGGDNDDDDSDGLTNFEEYAFGLDPISGSSVNPITVPLDKATGTFSYTRRHLALQDPDLSYTVWYSTDLATWTQDTAAVQGIPVDNGDVQTVPVTISADLLTHPKLFIQIRAE